LHIASLERHTKSMEYVLSTLLETVAAIGSGIVLLWLSGAVALQWYQSGGYRSDRYYEGE